MRNLEAWITVIVPAFFLIVWAINQVLNKEVRQPPRPMSGGGPVRRIPTLETRPTRPQDLWEETRGNLPRARPQPPPGRSEEIVILEVEDRPTEGGPNRGGDRPAARRPNASARSRRAARRTATRYQSAAPSDPRTNKSPTSMPGRPVGFAPTAPGFSAPIESSTPEVFRGEANSNLIAIQKALATPESIRQAFVLNLILQPPPSLRGLRQARRSGHRPTS